MKANESAVFFNKLKVEISADSLPDGGKPYRGYRISLVNLRVEKSTKKNAKILCDAVNTGRLPLIFSEKNPAPIELVVEFDPENLPENLQNHVSFERAIRKQKVNLPPGKLQKGIELTLDFSQEPPTFSENKVEKKVEMPPPPSQNLPKKQPEKPEKKQPEPELEVKKGCVDLVFDSVWVVKKSKKSVKLGFVIRNRGSATAKLSGESLKDDSDNLAVNVYFSGTKKLTRGSVLADGIFIGTDPKKGGLLLPNERFYAEIKISLENKTRFTPVAIFELDPFQTVYECDKTNNNKALILPD